MNKYKDSLKWNAIPTIFDVSNPPSPIQPHREAPTDRSQHVSYSVVIVHGPFHLVTQRSHFRLYDFEGH